MKSILTISSACILACTGLASAQNTPAPIPATPLVPAVPASELPMMSKEDETKTIDALKEMSSIVSTVTDKASADAAAEKLILIKAKMDSLNKGAQKPSQDFMMKMMGITMEMKPHMERVMKADFYGSTAMKDILSNAPKGAPAPAAK